MKKQVIAAALAGLTLIALPVFAKENGNHGKHKGWGMGEIRGILKKFTTDQFLVTGTVQSVGTNSFVVNVKASANVANITNGMVTVKTDANTNIPTTLAVGQNVVAYGSVSGTDLLATNVRVLNDKKKDDNNDEDDNKLRAQNVAQGSVTVKSSGSLTILNTLTNTSTTVTLSTDTPVTINGQSKSVADINVGDRGWVKFKTVGATLIAKIIRLFR